MTEERLITLWNAPTDDEWDRLSPPDWAAGRELSRGWLELGYGLEYNPGSLPFVMADAVDVVVVSADSEPTGGMGDASWEWDVTLNDGRKFHVEGWHDYTGWDCQSGLSYQEVVS